MFAVAMADWEKKERGKSGIVIIGTLAERRRVGK
jgi:hypothetical protein